MTDAATTSFAPSARRRFAALIVAVFAVLFPLWSNAYLSPPDSASYVAVPRSMVLDGDLNFANDYQSLDFEMYFFYFTRAGRISNDWPVGSGLVWLPVYAAAHATAKTCAALGINGRTFAADAPDREFLLPKPASVGAHDAVLAPTGQSGIYKLFLTTFCAGLAVLTFILAFGVSERFSGSRASNAAALLVLLGTPVGFYVFAFALMSHVVSMTAVGLLLWGWERTRGERTPRQWAALGALAGVVAMIRPQDAAFLVVFLVELAFPHPSRDGKRTVAGIALAGLCALLAFMPQMILWQVLYGNPFQVPKIEEMHWLDPELSETLFSGYHGLLSWSPVLLLVPFGLLLLARQDRMLAVGLGAALLVQVWLNSANEIWWAGGSFGNRRFVNCGFIFVIAIAAALRGMRMRYTLPVATLLAGWNLLLWAKERAGELSLDHYVPWDGEFFRGVVTVMNPAHFFVAMLGDFAGFGWPARLVFMVVALGFVVVIYQGVGQEKISSAKRVVGPLIITWLVVSTGFVAWSGARTGTLSREDLNPAIPESNVSLFNGYYEFGFYNMLKGRADASFAAYQKAAALRPEAPYPYRYMATIARTEFRDPRLALENSGRALDLMPRYEAALNEELAAIDELVRSGVPDTKELLERAERRKVAFLQK